MIKLHTFNILTLLLAITLMFVPFVPSYANSRPITDITSNAERGDPVAQFELGEIYKGGGLGLPQDYNEAAKWYRKAADQGYAPAETALGTRLLNKNDEEAYKWYQKAAEQGDPIAKQALTLRNSPTIAYIRGLPQGVRDIIAWMTVGLLPILGIVISGLLIYALVRVLKKYFPKWNLARVGWVFLIVLVIRYVLPLMAKQLTTP